jgi:hypothetical protein
MRRTLSRSIGYVGNLFNDEPDCGFGGKPWVLIEMLRRRKSVSACVKLGGVDNYSAARYPLGICEFIVCPRCLFWSFSSFLLVVGCVND